MTTKISSFKNYIETHQGVRIACAFTKMNRPTINHEKILKVVAEYAKMNKIQYRLYISKTKDKNKNPLIVEDRINFARKMFPTYAREIVSDVDIVDYNDILVKLYEQGYKEVTLFVNESRVHELDIRLNNNNGNKNNINYYYAFPNKINIKSLSIIDPDSDDAVGISSIRMRSAVVNEDVSRFNSMIPIHFKESNELFNKIRIGLGLKESSFDNKKRLHIELPIVSEEREAFVSGNLFKKDEIVLINNKKKKIKKLGPNFVVVEDNNGNVKRHWIKDVKKL